MKWIRSSSCFSSEFNLKAEVKILLHVSRTERPFKALDYRDVCLGQHGWKWWWSREGCLFLRPVRSCSILWRRNLCMHVVGAGLDICHPLLSACSVPASLPLQIFAWGLQGNSMALITQCAVFRTICVYCLLSYLRDNRVIRLGSPYR